MDENFYTYFKGAVTDSDVIHVLSKKVNIPSRCASCPFCVRAKKSGSCTVHTLALEAGKRVTQNSSIQSVTRGFIPANHRTEGSGAQG